MSYKSIDDAILQWAASRRLRVTTLYKDEEIRGFNLAGARGTRAQIWIDPPDDRGEVAVHAWDFQKSRIDVTCAAEQLHQTLDKAHDQASAWLAAGTSATPARLAIRLVIRLAASLALLLLAGFCAFGFLATFEKAPGYIAWRIGYGVIGLACPVGIAWLMIPSRSGRKLEQLRHV